MVGIADWGIGGVLVLVYGYGRFHTPKSVVGSTTLYRYYQAAILYLAAQLLLFAALSVVVASSPQLLAAMQIDVADIKEKIGAVSTPIMAALLMTTLLPNFPVLSQLDTKLLLLFQELGRIPLEVLVWRDRLARSQLQIPQEAVQVVESRLKEDERYVDLKPEYVRFEADDSPQYRFTRLIYLMTVIEDFGTARGKYPRVIVRFKEEYSAIKEDFKHAIARARRYFDAIAGHDHSASGAAILNELRRGFREQCQSSYKEMCQLLARGILLSEPTKRSRTKKLESLGFQSVEDSAARLDINQVLTIFSVLCLLLFSGIVLINGFAGGGRPLFMAVMAAVIYCVAVVCALVPKLIWRFADVGEEGERPVWAYLFSGALSVAGAFAIAIVFKSFLLKGLINALNDTRETYPWYLLSFSIAVILAAFSDNWGGRSKREPRWGRYAEGLGAAVLLTATFLLARGWLQSVAPDRPDLSVGVVKPAALVAVIGLFLGAFVPHWYRSMRSHAETETEQREDPLTETGSVPNLIEGR